MQKPSTDSGRFALTLSAASERGQVAAITAMLERHGAYIEEFAVFDDVLSSRFYVRTVFRLDGGAHRDIEALRRDYADVVEGLEQAEGAVHDLLRPTRVVVLVSKADHCLRDLLAQWRRGDLSMDIVAVVSNHTDLAPLAEAEGVPFHHLPINADNKPQQEADLLRCIEAHGGELVVLARYMQVLSEDLCRRLAGRVINIHHSFLPSFKGAKPYHQAHSRGVKLVGATAHYVTDDLDEGPIIEQDVVRVDHQLTPEELVEAGRDVEAQVLARAVRWHAERRVLLNGQSTVVFR